MGKAMKRPSSSSVMKRPGSSLASAMKAPMAMMKAPKVMKKAMKAPTDATPTLRDKQGYLYGEWEAECRCEFESERDYSASFKVRDEKSGRPVSFLNCALFVWSRSLARLFQEMCLVIILNLYTSGTSAFSSRAGGST